MWDSCYSLEIEPSENLRVSETFQVVRMPCNLPLSETLWGWLVPWFHSDVKDHMGFLFHFIGLLIFRAWIVAFGATWLFFHYIFTQTASALHMAKMLVSTFYLLTFPLSHSTILWSGNIVPSDQQDRSGKRAKVSVHWQLPGLFFSETRENILFLFDSSLSTTPENLCNNSSLAGGQQATFPEHSKTHTLLLPYPIQVQGRFS